MKENNYHMLQTEYQASWGISAVYFLRMLGIFVVLPVLPIYGLSLADSSETLIGIAIGIYGLIQAIFHIPFGLLSDRIGRLPLIIFGLLIFALGNSIAAMSHNIWGIIIGRAIQGLGAISSPMMALLSDLTSEQNRTKAMAFIGASFGISFAVAMVIGTPLTHAIGLSGLFWFIAALSLINIGIMLLIVPQSKHFSTHTSYALLPIKRIFIRVFKNIPLLRLNISILCLHLLLMLNSMTLPPLMVKAGLLPQDQWLVYFFTMLVSFMIVFPIIIYLEKYHMAKFALQLSIVLIILAELFLWFAKTNLWKIIIGLQMFFIIFNLLEALLPSMVSKASPDGYKGSAMGVFSTSQFIGLALGGSIGGYIYQHYGSNILFVLAAMIASIWFLLTLIIKKSSHNKAA